MPHEHDLEQVAAEKKRASRAPKPAPTESKTASDGDLRSAVGNAGMGRLLDASVGHTIEAELGGGKPLSAAQGVQRSRGFDTEGARIHDDATAADLSRQLGAVAFTYGRDIFLAGNAPDLESTDGQAMLRHELTHVRQQQRSGTTRPRRVSSSGSPAEQQATREQHGDTALSVPAGAGAVHRQEEEELVQEMPAETVHRQEEEEEVMPMPAETVHRQEQLEEEEEPLELASADAVHRKVPDPETKGAGAPAPANPAMAALFEVTVVQSLREAGTAMSAEKPDAETALAAITRATQGVTALHGAYAGRDEGLAARLAHFHSNLTAVRLAIQPMAGVGPDLEWIRKNLTSVLETAQEAARRLR